MEKEFDLEVIQQEVKVISQELLLNSSGLPTTVIGYLDDGRKLLLRLEYSNSQEKIAQYDAVRTLFAKHNVRCYAFASESWLSFDVEQRFGSPSQDPDRVETLLIASNFNGETLIDIFKIERDEQLRVSGLKGMELPDGISANIYERLDRPELIKTPKVQIRKILQTIKKTWLPSFGEPGNSPYRRRSPK